jgi:peptidoglycan biosynthesis protein MviN/MurJ (putative lipid II flippase)
MYGVSGLAMALSLTGCIELVVLLLLLPRKIGNYGLKSIVKVGAKITLASAAMGLVMYGMVRYIFPLYAGDVGFASLAPKFAVISIVGLTVYLLGGKALRIKEVHTVTSLVTKRFHKLVHRQG